MLFTASALTLTLGANTLYNYHIEREHLIAVLEQRIDTLSTYTAQITPSAILSYDFQTLETYMETLTQDPDVIYAVVIDSDGHTMTHHIDKENVYIKTLPRQLENPALLSLLDLIDQHPDILARSLPITLNNEVLGHIRLGITKKHIEKASAHTLTRQLISSSIIIAILGALIYVVYRLNTLRPITELVRGANRIAAGTLDEGVKVYSNDELGRLAHSFNDMVQTLRSSISEKDHALEQLREFNKTLESRVVERTLELEQANKNLEHLALHDTLTHLPNRALIQDRLKQAIHDAERSGQPFSVIMMDLDRFKEVNDSLGHDFGDRLLLEISQRLTTGLRKRDTVGRLGGDEFAYILPQTSSQDAIVVAHKIAELIEPPVILNEMAFSVSASLGIASFPEHGRDTTVLLKAADLAMYAAKHNNEHYCVYSDEMGQQDPQKLSIISELKDAINQHTLQLYYQPKIDANDHRIIGVEALTRWIHDTRGFIPPDEFIPVAERTGLIKQLTWWVLETAVRQSIVWQEQGIDICIAVNLSMHNIQDPQFPTQLSALMDAWGVDSSKLILEITESTIMSNPDRVLATLEIINRMGVGLSIDDFGTGYSSLSNLKKMPVNELKIDRSFVMDMMNDADDQAIVEAIIDMAHTMGLSVVAEGVEDQYIVQKLTELKCNFMQGYHISKPKPAEALYPMLKEGRWFAAPLPDAPAPVGIGKSA